MSNDKVEILRSGYQAFSETNSELQSTQQYLNDKAIDLLKIILLIGTLIASIITLANLYPSIVYIGAGSGILVISAIFCTMTFSHSKTYQVGVSEQAKDLMLNETDVEDHYRNLLIAYSNCVDDFDEQYQSEKKYFQSALETAEVAVFIFVLGAVKLLIVRGSGADYPMWFDVVPVVIIGVGIGSRLKRRFRQ